MSHHRHWVAWQVESDLHAEIGHGETVFAHERKHRGEGHRGRAVYQGSASEENETTDQRVSVVFDCCGRRMAVKRTRVERVFPAGVACDVSEVDTRRVGIVVYSTSDFRTLARSQPDMDESVLEIGCSLGAATEILLKQAARVVAIDKSEMCAAATEERCAGAEVHTLDPFFDQARLLEVAQGCKVVYADIGGNRQLPAVQHLISWLEQRLQPRLLVVKSESLFHKAVAVAAPDGLIQNSEEWWCALMQDEVNRWIGHPDLAPVVASPDNSDVAICRFHHFGVEECKLADDCRHDHEHCPLCLQPGHRGKSCTIYQLAS